MFYSNYAHVVPRIAPTESQIKTYSVSLKVKHLSLPTDDFGDNDEDVDRDGVVEVLDQPHAKGCIIRAAKQG